MHPGVHNTWKRFELIQDIGKGDSFRSLEPQGSGQHGWRKRLLPNPIHDFSKCSQILEEYGSFSEEFQNMLWFTCHTFRRQWPFSSGFTSLPGIVIAIILLLLENKLDKHFKSYVTNSEEEGCKIPKLYVRQSVGLKLGSTSKELKRKCQSRQTNILYKTCKSSTRKWRAIQSDTLVERKKYGSGSLRAEAHQKWGFGVQWLDVEPVSDSF